MCLLLKSSLVAQYCDGLMFQIANIVDIPLVARMRELSCTSMSCSLTDFVTLVPGVWVVSRMAIVFIDTDAFEIGARANSIKNNTQGIYFKLIVSSSNKNLRGL